MKEYKKPKLILVKKINDIKYEKPLLKQTKMPVATMLI
ncbi:hypothetical protein T458_24450 [Brevibacillus panacihumi W25]|uniref:Uncharacterized protein n=1 Tax=Brevibacillus panacihumi W25 TaxID=1408254 RepID=V6M0H3_9BACL|nr:hypothetical protein T458_24450 [Brevibacillus panacihumi W25]